MALTAAPGTSLARGQSRQLAQRCANGYKFTPQRIEPVSSGPSPEPEAPQAPQAHDTLTLPESRACWVRSVFRESRADSRQICC